MNLANISTLRPLYEEGGISLYCGDSLTILRTLRAESVHCCVTSPPYWGLRDYGTATWEGGDASCDHKQETRHQNQGATSARAGRQNVEEQRNDNFRDVCGKCGARRIDSQIGLERTPEEYVARLVELFREVRRVLRADGTLWLIIGDSYARPAAKGKHGPSPKQDPNTGTPQAMMTDVPDGLKPKDLVGIPWRLAFALQADGWYLRSDIIWSKPNPMPESVTDRPTKSHEYLFLLSKSERYHYDAEAIAESTVSDHGSGNGFKRAARLSYLDDEGPRGNEKPWKPNGKHAATDPQAPGRRMVENVARARALGAEHDNPFGGTRNRRSVWTVNTEPYPEAHFATFPPDLIRPCILAGCPRGGVVLEPFAGSGTTLQVAKESQCGAVGIELNPEYCELITARLQQSVFDFMPEVIR